ncbi:MAG: hypothetical protein QF473_32650, partial [Planctomycetota bacterium]|nr:hypothetical protein [Planctomycetota bacterium]
MSNRTGGPFSNIHTYICMNNLVFLLALIPIAATQAEDKPAPKVSDYYTLEEIPIPKGEMIEVGGTEWMPDGRLAVSTRR